VTTCYRPSSLGHHQVVSIIRRNYTICDKMCNVESLVSNEILFSSIKYYYIFLLKYWVMKTQSTCFEKGWSCSILGRCFPVAKFADGECMVNMFIQVLNSVVMNGYKWLLNVVSSKTGNGSLKDYNQFVCFPGVTTHCGCIFTVR
jgi:hypothetical protein